MKLPGKPSHAGPQSDVHEFFLVWQDPENRQLHRRVAQVQVGQNDWKLIYTGRFQGENNAWFCHPAPVLESTPVLVHYRPSIVWST